ncbi:MAG: hypothetical protein IKE41_02730 [Clostridia bacterium]|nr:hypothetical protein [Clostridia bacterium]MBR2735396.1 hypothetical protein [Clostridia bacterium]
MQKNKFDELYTKMEEARKLYQAGEQEKSRQNYGKIKETLKEQETEFNKIWSMYDKAKENGNQYIDFHDVIWDNEVEGIVKTLRDNGIERFTFSSGWTSAVKTAWLFKENGCTLEGLTEVYDGFEDFTTGKKTKIPAYLFKVN